MKDGKKPCVSPQIFLGNSLVLSVPLQVETFTYNLIIHNVHRNKDVILIMFSCCVDC